MTLERLKEKWVRLDLWCWSSGARDLVNLLRSCILFLVYFCSPMTLVLGGFLQLLEVRGDQDPVSIGLYVISIVVCFKGANKLEKEGWK